MGVLSWWEGPDKLVRGRSQGVWFNFPPPPPHEMQVWQQGVETKGTVAKSGKERLAGRTRSGLAVPVCTDRSPHRPLRRLPWRNRAHQRRRSPRPCKAVCNKACASEIPCQSRACRLRQSPSNSVTLRLGKLRQTPSNSVKLRHGSLHQTPSNSVKLRHWSNSLELHQTHNPQRHREPL